jgi:sugar phosphate isomerase/epimerase
MFFSGISDEAGQSIDTQIRAHKDLGWDYMELRMVDGENIASLSDAKFEEVYEKVASAGLKVSCFGSAIANWARNIRCDSQIDIDDLARAIPRMRRFGTPFIRVMSYPNDPEKPLSDVEWREEVVSRMRVLADMAGKGGITLVHENCSGWGGLSAENCNRLVEAVGSPALKVVYDTGNPVTYGQDPWAFYQSVRRHIAYVHIKDARKGDGHDVYTYPGEGDGRVRDTVRDLASQGYEGGLSIEPHLAAVIHTGEKKADPQELYDSYIEYGRRLMRLVEEVAPQS